MSLHTALFGTFNPPPAVNVRRYTFMGGELFDEGYRESALTQTINKRKAQRLADCQKAYQFIRANPETTAAKLAMEFQWGHHKASCILDALIMSKQVKRRGINTRASGAKTYFYVAA